jgi:membrane-associated phospholipid phosphatase
MPRGRADLFRQLVLFGGAYWLYRLVRGQVDGRASAAFENARHIIGAERKLGAFFEPALHGWATRHGWVVEAATWTYVNSHFAVTTAALAFLYLRRNDRFYAVRDMFAIAMGIALLGYIAFPTAPPRLMPEWGFGDPVAELTGVEASNALFNPFAAVPSMHVAFALMLAVPLARMVRRRWARALWWSYPAVVTFAVIATANHWWLDAFLGAATAAVAAVAAHGVLARVRPPALAPAH